MAVHTAQAKAACDGDALASPPAFAEMAVEAALAESIGRRCEGLEYRPMLAHPDSVAILLDLHGQGENIACIVPPDAHTRSSILARLLEENEIDLAYPVTFCSAGLLNIELGTFLGDHLRVVTDPNS